MLRMYKIMIHRVCVGAPRLLYSVVHERDVSINNDVSSVIVKSKNLEK